MKILYLVEDFSENGGVERIVSQKASILSTEYGHDVSILSVYRDERPILYPIDKGVRMLHLDVPFADKKHGRTLTLVSRVRTLLLAASRMNRKIEEIRPDIIFFTTTLGALLLPLCRTKAVRIYESHLARRFTPYRQLFGLMERRADIVVCLTEGDAREYRRARRVTVIPNFIHKPMRHVGDYNLKRAVAVGRLERQKGFDMLVSMWADIAKEHPDWRLDIYGEGSEHEALQRQIDSLGLGGLITLRGRSNDMANVYPEYSLHLMPSRYEGQPITLIEAQAAGLPSVVFDFKYGAADVIKDGVNGIIVDEGDTDAFIQAATDMMGSASMRKEYGESAQVMAHAYFEENIIGKWTDIILQTQ